MGVKDRLSICRGVPEDAEQPRVAVIESDAESDAVRERDDEQVFDEDAVLGLLVTR
jgi:hypothetical protein